MSLFQLPKILGNIRIFGTGGNNDTPDERASEAVRKFENAVVEEGLTHIKRNKFAPTPEEAKNLTDEEFRTLIYKRMKEDERERRKNGPVGGAVADEYEKFLNAKNRPPSTV